MWLELPLPNVPVALGRCSVSCPLATSPINAATARDWRLTTTCCDTHPCWHETCSSWMYLSEGVHHKACRSGNPEICGYAWL